MAKQNEQQQPKATEAPTPDKDKVAELELKLEVFDKENSGLVNDVKALSEALGTAYRHLWVVVSNSSAGPGTKNLIRLDLPKLRTLLNPADFPQEMRW